MESIGKKCNSNAQRIERRIRETYQRQSDRKWGWKKNDRARRELGTEQRMKAGKKTRPGLKGDTSMGGERGEKEAGWVRMEGATERGQKWGWGRDACTAHSQETALYLLSPAVAMTTSMAAAVTALLPHSPLLPSPFFPTFSLFSFSHYVVYFFF